MPKRKAVYISIIGGYECSAEDSARAEEVGRLLAESGAILVSGGRMGISEAACRGAKSGGGMTIGILPSSEYGEANDYVDHAICTGIGEARNLSVVLTGDGVIAMPGRYGTLSEIAFALLNRRPVVSLGSWDIDPAVIKTNTPQEAVQRILQEVRR